jgi:hypothetical protein
MADERLRYFPFQVHFENNLIQIANILKFTSACQQAGQKNKAAPLQERPCQNTIDGVYFTS